MTPLIYIRSPSKFTIQMGLRAYEHPLYHDEAATMSMTVVSLIAPLIVFFLAQRSLVRGIVLTGIKG